MKLRCLIGLHDIATVWDPTPTRGLYIARRYCVKCKRVWRSHLPLKLR